MCSSSKLPPQTHIIVTPEKINKFYDLKSKTIDQTEFLFSSLKNKVVLMVNTASKCGYTNQYELLEKLYLKYHQQGLMILGFPSNDFWGQEPGTNEEIKNFCKLNYKVSFPLMTKLPVSGPQKQSVYEYLIQVSFDGKTEIAWNFEKILIDRSGRVRGRYLSKVLPLDSEIEEMVIQLLNQQ